MNNVRTRDRVKQSALFSLILLLTLFFTVLEAHSANHYIRAGASDNNSGSDWTNAWTDLPTTFVRGDTYYVASGNYAKRIFNTPVSGTTYIYIKKATVDNHGTNVGWDNSYATGQAIWDGTDSVAMWYPKTGYWEFDGATGSGTSGHGFKVRNTDTSGNSATIYVVNNFLVTHLVFKHVEIVGAGWNAGNSSIGFLNNSTAACSNFTFQYCYFHDCGAFWLKSGQNAPNWLIEHSYFKNVGSGNSSLHSAGVGIYGMQANMNVVIRYNVFENVAKIGGSGYILLGDDAGGRTSSGYDVYGNVIWASSPLEGPGLYSVGNASGDYVTGVRIYNNTFYGLQGTGSGIFFGHADSTVVASNNVWQNCTYAPNFTRVVESSNVKNTGGIRFRNPETGDFRLADKTDPGLIFPSQYATDPTGHQRGLNSTWDMGAFQYRIILRQVTP